LYLSRVIALTVALALGVTPAVPDAARKRYADAGAKLAAGEYGPANDLLNQLAADFPRWAEVFASRCSAQLGLKHWDAAVADCNYALVLKPKLPVALYGLAVAEDGRRNYPEAVKDYRAYAALDDPQATLKAQATQRADMLAARTSKEPAESPPPLVAATPAVTPVSTTPTVAAPPSTAAPPPPSHNFQPGIPSSGRMLLYVFRNLVMGLNTPVTLLVDNKNVGALPNDGYVELDLAPGKHQVTVRAAAATAGAKEPVATWELNSAEGDVLYVKLDYAPQGDDVAFKPIPVKGNDGRKEIREDCGLVLSKRF
jgi:tetratricopeptide (TPR) repeat protein